ncbi:MAG: sterol desaturase family protein [Thermoanaerobaculia bacterium]
MPQMEHEWLIRSGAFVAILISMLAWEFVVPLHHGRESRLRHDARNLAVLLLDSLTVRLVLPILPVGLAQLATERNWGLFNHLPLAPWLSVGLTIVAFDLAIYLQHLTFHAVPVLWRLHMVHHSDLQFDATTGVRFHPIEIALSAGVKLGLVLILGPPAVGVMVFEILLNASSLFNHANARLLLSLDRWLRWIIVTPDMHRVHHSADRPETNSNFGFNLPWWDRVFRTYRDQPRAGHGEMIIGLEHLRNPHHLTLGRLLVMPFLGTGGVYPMIRPRDDG